MNDNTSISIVKAEPREVMNVAELADFLDLDRKTVYDYAGRGVIPHRRVGKRLLFSRAAVELALASVSPVYGCEQHPPSHRDAAAIMFANLMAMVGEEMLRLAKSCEAKDTAPGFTYAVRCGEFVKIGQAIDPAKRIRDLQAMNPNHLELIGLCHGLDSETDLHQFHADERIHGEWFLMDVNPLSFDGACWSCRGGLKPRRYR